MISKTALPSLPRQLPRGGRVSTAIGIGGAYLTEGLFPGADRAVIDAAFEAGARHFDTAPLYGMGTSESLLGRALKGRRDQVTIATKVGLARPRASFAKRAVRSIVSPVRSAIAGVMPRRAASGGGEVRSLGDFSVQNVRGSLEESLRLLQTDYVDIYLLHEVRPADVSAELLELLAAFRQEGKIANLGLATSPPDSAVITAQYPGQFDVVQTHWSVLDGQPEGGAGSWMAIHHRSILRAYAPLRVWFAQDSAVLQRLSDVAGRDLADDRELSAVLIGAAIAANPQGITLVASRSVSRTLGNVQAGLDPSNHDAGARLLAALADEPSRPRPR
jgi:aryl-alcohol dehydrogenase-like predicted oxidoreductase